MYVTIYENMKVISRVKNAKNRFRALSKGAATSNKIGGIIAKLKEGAQDEKKNVAFSHFQKRFTQNNITFL